MALQGSASANLSPILFKGNNRAFAINLIIHQDESGSMSPFIEFYATGSFIGTLQDALLEEGIGLDVDKYPNIYGYFDYQGRNPTTPFSITNREGTLTVSQSFIKGQLTGAATISAWTGGYINNLGTPINICTDILNTTTGGRLLSPLGTTYSASALSEDVHGNLWSIYTSPNAISTGTPGVFGSIISSVVRKNTATIIITNSDEQDGCPDEMFDNFVDVGLTSPELIINGTFDAGISDWISFNGSVNTWINPPGQMRILRDSGSPNSNATYQAFTTVVGRTYRVSADIITPAGNLGTLQIRNGTGWSGTLLLSLAGTAGATVTVTGLFTATSTTTTLGFVVRDTNEFITVDNISVRQNTQRTINGLSGEMLFREFRVIALSSYTSPELSPPLSIPFVQNTRTGMTVNFNGYLDDNFRTLTLPFSISFLGTPYTTLYVGTNGYFTFSNGSSTNSVTSPTSPALPGIKVFAGDRILNWLGARTQGVAPNRTHTVRWEGADKSDTFSVESVAFEENTRTGMTVNFSGYLDDNFRTLTLPFTVNFLGTSYATVLFGTNGYFTFGTGSSTASVTSPTSPAFPGIKAIAGDKILNWLGAITEGVAPNRTYTVRWEGGDRSENFVESIPFVQNTRTGMTQQYSGSLDDSFRTLTLPFSVSFLGSSYGTLYVGTNGYFTFSGGSDTFSSVTSPISPALPGIKVFAADRILNWLGFRTQGVSPNRTYTIRWEGRDFVDDGFGITLIYEAIFYEGQNYIDLHYVAYRPDDRSSTSAMQNGTSSSFVATWSPTTNAVSPFTTGQGFRIYTRNRITSQIYETKFYEGQNYIDLHYVVNQPVPVSVSALQDGVSSSYLATWSPTTNAVSPYTTGQGFRVYTINSNISHIYEAIFYEGQTYIDLHYVSNKSVATSVSALQDGTSASYLTTWNPSSSSVLPYTTGQGFRIFLRTIDGVVFYGEGSDKPYGYITFPSSTTFTITRTATPPVFTPDPGNQNHDTYDLANITRGAIFKIARVFETGVLDNRTAFSNCLTEFLRTTL